MNNYSFLDSNAQHQSRPPPSPSQGSVAGSQVNGGQQNGIPMVNGLPSGGQQTDMNHLWAVVQQLSQLLEENKAQTQGIVNGVAALQGRAAEEGGAVMGVREVNGEISGMCSWSQPQRQTLPKDTTADIFHSSNTYGRSHKPSVPALLRPADHIFPHSDNYISLHPSDRL